MKTFSVRIKFRPIQCDSGMLAFLKWDINDAVVNRVTLWHRQSRRQRCSNPFQPYNGDHIFVVSSAGIPNDAYATAITDKKLL
jgi:hypothetical protein